MKRRLLLCLVSLSCLLMSCGSPLKEGVTAFYAADYPGAARAWERVQVSSLASSEQARFTLYRGLTYAALGDAKRSHRDLGTAWAALTRDPHCLNARDSERLRTAWATLGLTPGEATPTRVADAQAATP